MLFSLFRTEASLATTGKETTVRRPGVLLFSGIPSPDAFRVQNSLIEKLVEMSPLRWQAVSETSTFNKSSKEIRGAGKADAFMIGEYSENRLRLILRGRRGNQDLVRWVFPKELDSEKLPEWSEKVAAQIIQSFPYRGIVVARKGKKAKVSVGSLQGVKTGDLLPIYEFQEKAASFSGNKKNIGTVKVRSVKKNSAIVIAQDQPVPLYGKVGFAVPTEKASAQYRQTGTLWTSVGWQVNSIDNEFTAIPINSREYNIDFTPFLTFAIGHKKWEIEFQGGKAESDLDIVRMGFATGLYNLKSWGTSKRAWILSAGVHARAFASEKKVDSSLAKGSASSVHPLVNMRWSFQPRPSSRFFIDTNIRYFLFEQGGDTSSAAKSALIGAGLGMKVELSDQLGVEAGFQGSTGKIALTGGSEFDETQLGLFTRAVVYF